MSIVKKGKQRFITPACLSCFSAQHSPRPCFRKEVKEVNDFTAFKAILSKRMNESEEKYWVEDLWKEEIGLFVEDMEKTIRFVNQCTDDEICWMSEVFDDIANATHSVAFFKAAKTRAARIADEEDRKEVLSEIEYASGFEEAISKEKRCNPG